MTAPVQRQKEVSMEERLARLGAEIDEVWRRAADRGELLGDRIEGRTKGLVKSLEDDIQRLEARVEVMRGRLEQDRAETLGEFERAIERELAAWRDRIQHLQVQVSLGRMELRDTLAEARNTFHHVQTTVTDRLEWMRKVGDEPWPGLREEIRASMEELAEEMP